jgi:glycosyltransferase involved in cell wall biosynthesis
MDYSFSIILCLQNCETTILEAIQNLPQEKNVEIICIFNQSTDKTQNIVKQYLPQAKIHSIELSNLSYARNLGVFLSQSPYIAFMDGDDISFPNRFYQHFEFLEKNPHIAAVGGQCILFDDNHSMKSNLFLEPEEIEIDSLFRVPLFLGAGMIRKYIFQKIRYPLMPIAGDWQLLIELMNQNYRFVNLPEASLYYRQHHKNITLPMRQEKSLSTNPISALRANRLLNYSCILSPTELELFLRSSCSVHKLFFSDLSIQKNELLLVKNIFDKIIYHIPNSKKSSAQKVLEMHLSILQKYSKDVS